MKRDHAEPHRPGRPSLQPRLGLWQVAQETLPERERRGSKNRVLPSASFSGLCGLAFGNGTWSGRRNRCFSAARSACIEPTVAVAEPDGMVRV